MTLDPSMPPGLSIQPGCSHWLAQSRRLRLTWGRARLFHVGLTRGPRLLLVVIEVVLQWCSLVVTVLTVTGTILAAEFSVIY